MVKQRIQQLKSGKSASPEEIDAELLKRGPEKLYSILAHLFTKYNNGEEMSTKKNEIK